MQDAIPYRRGRAWTPQPSKIISYRPLANGGEIVRVVAENPVVVVGQRGCCMVHVIKHLLMGQGANLTVWEFGDDTDETVLMKELSGGAHQDQDQNQHQQHMVFPVVFIGGRLVGGLENIMAVHIAGDLVPKLKEAGTLWL